MAKSTIDILGINDSINEAGEKTSKMTPTELNKWFTGIFINSAIIACGLCLGAICFLWWEHSIERKTYLESISNFNASIQELNMHLAEREDVLSEIVKQITILNERIGTLEHTLIKNPAGDVGANR